MLLSAIGPEPESASIKLHCSLNCTQYTLVLAAGAPSYQSKDLTAVLCE
jgi:hypothetical protein